METRELTVNLPESISVVVDGTTYPIKTEKWAPEFVMDLVEQGVKIKLQRAGAGKGDKAAARATVVTNLNAGEIGKKAADPQAAAMKALGKLTPEQQQALIAMLQQQQA